MPCTPVKLPGGGMALVRHAHRRIAPCRYCAAQGTRLCDFPVLRGLHKGTCDAPLCERCATRISSDRDLCRAHLPLWDLKADKPRVGPGAA